MLVRLDPSSTVPLYDQVAVSIRRALSDGGVTSGERLPPARELAHHLEINVHTVLRAYALLRDEGLIELRRGRGAVVAPGADRNARLTALAKELADEAHRLGVGLDELVTILRRSYP
ncbi:GntR family transcriptional regulator [Saccharomonospora halophila]|uniref:GntR family transcriptional regulator n=1 Tax=Saccharomonospora halophila TaxID=129922 RepID=UPI00036F03CE|nr:GntR family transcriptional regulator [Saccharomonospora halophila]